jgi:hypothetical protein
MRMSHRTNSVILLLFATFGLIGMTATLLGWQPPPDFMTYLTFAAFTVGCIAVSRSERETADEEEARTTPRIDTRHLRSPRSGT